jgi:hypothetical protein
MKVSTHFVFVCHLNKWLRSIIEVLNDCTEAEPVEAK